MEPQFFHICLEDECCRDPVDETVLVVAILLGDAPIYHGTLGDTRREAFVDHLDRHVWHSLFQLSEEWAYVGHGLGIGAVEAVWLAHDDDTDVLMRRIVLEELKQLMGGDRSEWTCDDAVGVADCETTPLLTVVYGEDAAQLSKL